MTGSAKLQFTPKKQVTVIIVTYRSLGTIGATLDGLQESYNVGLVDVIVIDNASNDGTADFVASNYPTFTLVRNHQNIGFGRACNQGLERVSTPYVLLLNPDAVLENAGLKVLLRFMNQAPRAGMCGPAVVEASGALQPAGALPSPWKIMLSPLLPGWASQGSRQVVPGEQPLEANWICGSVILLHRKMIEEIGGFDPCFFLYFEETDLCCRARRKGYEIWTVGEAVAEHVNAASAKTIKAHMMWGTISEHYFRSRFYYMKKHFGVSTAYVVELGELFCMFVRAAVDLVRGRTYSNLGQRLRAPILKSPAPPEALRRCNGCEV